MEITKLRSQLSMVLEQVAVHLQRAWSTLARLGRNAAEKLHEARCAGENALRKLQASFHEVVVVTNGKIERFRSQLSMVLEQVAVYLQRAWSTLARLGRNAAEKLHEARCVVENDLRELQASFHEVVVVTNGKIQRFTSQLSMVLEQVAVHLQRAWSTLARRGRNAAEKLHEARCVVENDVRELQASFHEVVVVTNGKIQRFTSQLSIVLRQVAVYVQKLLSTPVMLGRKVADKRRRSREARLARQNDLRTLLTSSPDPVIVTNRNRRLVAANSHGLHLFGVSELNMSQFTIGTFLSHGQILEFDRNRSSFERPEERHGKCKIRRLDGTSWVAECIFVANVVPHQDLYRFQHCREERPGHHH